jgi:hypothetical protein
MLRPLLTAMVILGFLQWGCKNNPVEPLKDPRTYTWTIDTLAYPGSFQTSMRDIWASSPTNVYVVGHNDGSGAGTMFRFDGKSWKTTGFHAAEGGPVSGAVSLSAIYGFSASNLFAVGSRIYDNPNPPPNFLHSSLIIHFDGRQWREQRAENGKHLRTIGGSSPSMLLAGGQTNRIFQYDGTTWKQDSLPVIVQTDGFFIVEAFESTASGEVFAIGYTHHNSIATTIHYFFRRQMGRWIAVDSFFVGPGRLENKWGHGDLWLSPSGTLYSCGRGVHRWDGARWEMLFDHPNFLARMIGTSDDNIFVVGHFGTVLHYNGRDWFQYRQFEDPNNVFWGVWADQREVFVVGFTAEYPQKTLILRGR